MKLLSLFYRHRKHIKRGAAWGSTLIPRFAKIGSCGMIALPSCCIITLRMRGGRPNGWTDSCAETPSPFSRLHVIKTQVNVKGWARCEVTLVEVTVAAGGSYQISGLVVEARWRSGWWWYPNPHPLSPPPPLCSSGQCPSLPLTAYSISITLNWTWSGWSQLDR